MSVKTKTINDTELEQPPIFYQSMTDTPNIQRIAGKAVTVKNVMKFLRSIEFSVIVPPFDEFLLEPGRVTYSARHKVTGSIPLVIVAISTGEYTMSLLPLTNESGTIVRNAIVDNKQFYIEFVNNELQEYHYNLKAFIYEYIT